jgi:hypothetical protein
VPEMDLVMVYFETVMRATPDFEPIWELEEFQNVVLSAIDD